MLCKQVVHGYCGLENTAVHAVGQAIGGDEGHLYVLPFAHMVRHPVDATAQDLFAQGAAGHHDSAHGPHAAPPRRDAAARRERQPLCGGAAESSEPNAYLKGCKIKPFSQLRSEFQDVTCSG